MVGVEKIGKVLTWKAGKGKIKLARVTSKMVSGYSLEQALMSGTEWSTYKKLSLTTAETSEIGK